MTRTALTPIAAVALVAIAAGVASNMGGREGYGVLLGALLGAGICGVSALFVQYILRAAPRRVFAAVGVSFLVKLLALLAGGLAFRYVDVLAERADWMTFLVAFGVTVVVMLPLSAMAALPSAAARPIENGGAA